MYTQLSMMDTSGNAGRLHHGIGIGVGLGTTRIGTRDGITLCTAGSARGVLAGTQTTHSVDGFAIN